MKREDIQELKERLAFVIGGSYKKEILADKCRKLIEICFTLEAQADRYERLYSDTPRCR